MLVFRVIFNYLHVTLAIVILAGKVNSKFCNGGHICSPPKECCPLGCCLVLASPGYRPTISQISEASSSMSGFLQWNHWLLWGLLTLLLLFCMCGCGLWKKRQFFANRLCRRSSSRNDEERSELDSAGSCYPPPQYSRCSSFHYAPPPYTEVTSKPDLYPLVISYRPDSGKFGDNCLMVQYFRNYVVHPALGSLSAGSTVDSISSSFFSQSAHEADINFPPSYEESRIEERALTELEPLPAPNNLRCQQNNFLTQGQILRNNGRENVVENNEMQHVIVENIQQSIQKASTTVVGVPKLKSNLPATLKNFKTLQNSTQSLPSNLCSEPTTKQKKVVRPTNLYLTTFKRINKSVLLSTSTDSINGNNGYPAHQYTSDVILAQPQSYCESNNELHYYSSDILNNANHFLHNVNNSYSSEDNLSQPRGSLQDFVSSDGLSHSQFSNLEMNNFSTSSDVSSLQGCGSPDSPPQATSPTGEFRNLLDKIQQLPIHRESSKLVESSKGLNFSNNRLKTFQVPFSEVENPSGDSDELSETESVEKSCLLNESAQSVIKTKAKKVTAIRPNKLTQKQNFPSRSKTFNMSFCHSSLSLKKSSNSKLSTSAPVTPVTNIPSPGSLALSFASNVNKFGSKKNLENKSDGRPLLHDDNESNDEVF